MRYKQTNHGIELRCDHPSRSAVEVEIAIKEVLRCIRADKPATANKAVDDWSPEDLADLIIHMPLAPRAHLSRLAAKKESKPFAGGYALVQSCPTLESRV